MNERDESLDPKLRSVVLARFSYRHEAEFAAGFLDDAGIPYRLEIDDPAMGLVVATSATLWVRAMDLDEAREVVDLPEVRAKERSLAAPRRAAPVPRPPARAGVGRPALLPEPLTPLERVVSLVLAAASAAAVPAALAVPAGAVIGVGLGLLSTGFGIGVLVGRTAPPLHRFVKALSGGAP